MSSHTTQAGRQAGRQAGHVGWLAGWLAVACGRFHLLARWLAHLWLTLQLSATHCMVLIRSLATRTPRQPPAGCCVEVVRRVANVALHCVACVGCQLMFQVSCVSSHLVSSELLMMLMMICSYAVTYCTQGTGKRGTDEFCGRCPGRLRKQRKPRKQREAADVFKSTRSREHVFSQG